ncbi:MAG: hypothetical protein GF311_20515 [Candidatus Lokiarchaeota archaeon]|nr:hypothetical protein [Candidatus Lokiarchaeota archaeon]
MKNIIDGLYDMDTGNLRNIAEKYNIMRWEDAPRKDLINKIEARMREPGFEEDMKEKLDDEMIIILDEVLNGDNYETVEKVKQRFLDIKATADFRETYENLLSLGLIFEGRRDDKDIVYVPKELTKWINNHVSQKLA